MIETGIGRKQRGPVTRPILVIGVALMALYMASACGTDLPTYTNPVFEPVLADPSVIRADDGYFYAYGTEDDWGDHWRRLVPIVRSDDLVNWEFIGEAFDRRPTWKAQGGIWAPHIAHHASRYVLYYSVSTWGDPNPGIGVAVSDTPEGPFEDKGKLFLSDEIGVPNSIDPMMIVDDGTPYLFWGSWHGIHGVRLSDDGLSVAGEKFRIAGTAFEAAWIHKTDEYYYFMGSLGSCCEGEQSTYRVAVGRSESLRGPYLDRDGRDLLHSEGTLILAGHTRGHDADPGFVGPGHHAMITDDAGDDWMLYHAMERGNARLPNGVNRRVLMLDRIVWEDGWPTIPGMVPGTGEQPAPRIE